MRKQERDLVLDFLTLVVAISLSVIIVDFTIKIRPPGAMEKAFQENFKFSIFSFGICYLLFQSISYLFSLLFLKISLSDWTRNFLWILTIISGTFLFAHFTDKAPFFNAEMFFLRFFLILIFILVPSVIFRLTINSVIYFWQERKKWHSPIVK